MTNIHAFTLKTLIDITASDDRDAPSAKNYANIMNGLGLHFQPLVDSDPRMSIEDVSAFGIKSNFNRMVWSLPFTVEGDAVFSVEIAIRAIDGTPVADQVYDEVRTAPGAEGGVNLRVIQHKKAVPAPGTLATDPAPADTRRP